MSSFDYKYFNSLSEREKSDLEKKNNSFWQSGIWAEILAKTNQAEVIIASNNAVQIVIERRKIWRKYTGLYILGINGEIITKDFLQSLQEEIVAPYDLFLQLEPLEKVHSTQYRVHSSLPLDIPLDISPVQSTAPFRRFIEPVTAMLSLKSPGSEEVVDETVLMASFAEKGRYNIRLAQKRGVTTRWVEASEACNEEGRMKNEEGQNIKNYIKAFYNLLDETTKRDGFAHNSLAYYQHFVETLESHNAGGLLVAEKDGVLHAAGIFAYWGDTAIYYYGASSSDATIRRDMATYLLQWDAIREGITRGCKTYDFLGISEDGKGKLAGVTEFKLRFNPEKKYWPSERVVIFKPITLFLLQCVSRIRKWKKS